METCLPNFVEAHPRRHIASGNAVPVNQTDNEVLRRHVSETRLAFQISSAIQAGSRDLVDCRARHSLAGSISFSCTTAPRE